MIEKNARLICDACEAISQELPFLGDDEAFRSYLIDHMGWARSDDGRDLCAECAQISRQNLN